MTNAETIWNVISWYYGNSTPIGLLLIVMTVYLLSRKKEYRYYTIGGLFFSFLILNQLTYRVITKLGEGSTYYRFLWMFPVSLLAAWFLLKILERIESGWIKAVCVIMAGVWCSYIREWGLLSGSGCRRIFIRCRKTRYR